MPRHAKRCGVEHTQRTASHADPPLEMQTYFVQGVEYEIPNDGRETFSISAAQKKGGNPKRKAAVPADDVLDLNDGRSLRGAMAPRAEVRPAKRQAEDNHRTRAASEQPASAGEAAARRADLSGNARELESMELAEQTMANYGTALNWWTRFILWIALPVRVLSFDATIPAAKHAVGELCRQFLQFTHRCIGMFHTNSGPADPDTSYTYWSQIVRMHKRLEIDLGFTDAIAKRWRGGAQRSQVTAFGPRLKKSKAMFSLQHIIDLYATPWTGCGGKRNPTRRRLAMRAAPQLAIQVLFRASEYLKPKSKFRHTIHLSRAHITYHSWDWSREYKPAELTPNHLRELLDSGDIRALVRMPQLKNDQYLNRGFPPTALELNDGPVCALRHMLLMEIDDPLLTLAARRSAPMFVDPDTGTGLTKLALRDVIVSMTHHILTAKYHLKITIEEVRTQWSLHSFRVTGQNLLREAGAEEWQIRQAGRWLSNCALRYDRANLETLSALGKAMSGITSQIQTHLTIPGVPTYPYPVETLHKSLQEHTEAKLLKGAGTYKLSAQSQRQQYFRESTSPDAQTPPEVQLYTEHLKTQKSLELIDCS